MVSAGLCNRAVCGMRELKKGGLRGSVCAQTTHRTRSASRTSFRDLVVFQRAAALRIHSLDGNLADPILPQCDFVPRFEPRRAAVSQKFNVVAAVVVPDQPCRRIL